MYSAHDILYVQQSYGSGVEAVKEPLGPRLSAPELLDERKQRQQSMTFGPISDTD